MKKIALALVCFAASCLNKSATAAEPVRVMSFNIRYGTANDGENHWNKRKIFLAETIATFEPDLLGTQETLADQRDFLAEKLVGYQSLGVGRDDGKDAGEMAALFYRSARFEKLADGHFWLSETPDVVGSKGWDAALPRIATWVRLKDRQDAKGKTILFLNTHFDHRGGQARWEAAKLIRRKVADLGQGSRIIITGDFNASEDSQPYAALFSADNDGPSSIVDTFRTLHTASSKNTASPKNEGTFSGFKAEATSGARIDWIGCSRDWDVRLAGIDRTARNGSTPSDHFPVYAVLRTPQLETSLSILSYNIHHGEGTDGVTDLKRIARVIRKSDADIVALQEVDKLCKRSGSVDQSQELAMLTGMNALFGRAIDFDGGQYGQTLLSRTPLELKEVHRLPGEANREQRIALEALTTIDGQLISLVTTHFDHLGGDSRERQATMIHELFAKVDRPVIMAGDFNATIESKPMQTLKQSWTIAGEEEHHPTFPSASPSKQIDFVLFRPVKHFYSSTIMVVDEPIASDHRPVLGVLFTRNPTR